MSSFMMKWIVKQEEEGMLVREFLLQGKSLSRSMLTDIKFKGGRICVNGVSCNVRTVLHDGDNVEITFPEEEISESMTPMDLPLHIIYEDEHFLLVNKEANLPTIPSRHSVGSLAQAVLYYYKKMKLNRTIHAVNRLDRDTSGLVLFAKHRFAHDLLSKQQRTKEMKRMYLAFVHGGLHGNGKVNAPIGRREGSIIERTVRSDGQHAVTEYNVIESDETYSLLELSLQTGRTHQIRVHMASIGHALLGDDLYGGTNELILRQALHSAKLEFYHPFLERNLTFEADLPEDMKKLIQKR
ncbi:RluA family pseudouridine synthase [Bacillus sp. NTK071]|uniref:RluA family pseudouridine synthase n=1 Tax=Bacillus sp. NTK071 TaxID=2802175 RepID=UPI001A8E6F72|nr:RluA family pseudouridine synthase [Bacillus sp. NTK071]MBN8207244.1 RluA family pseudouridine synthase [Bacillus sp. NTK071]